MKSICLAGALAAATALLGCAGGSSGSPSVPATAGQPAASGVVSVPAPPLSDIERATFAPSLDIHLDRMTRRQSGLYVEDIKSGTGAVATRGRTVVVRYTGWLTNGKSFDSGEITVTLGSNKTIRAWEDGLLGMRVGGRRRLVVPPSMGYGPNGSGEIPPNAVLVFEMEMTAVL